jgi:uncharacterized protein (DUF2237 family)
LCESFCVCVGFWQDSSSIKGTQKIFLMSTHKKTKTIIKDEKDINKGGDSNQ